VEKSQIRTPQKPFFLPDIAGTAGTNTGGSPASALIQRAKVQAAIYRSETGQPPTIDSQGKKEERLSDKSQQGR
jgi:hypothetical protein